MNGFADVKVNLFKPVAFNEHKRDRWWDVIRVLVFNGMVVMSRTDFERAVFHVITLCLFEVKWWPGGSKQSQELLWVFPSRVLYSPDLPAIVVLFSGTKKPRIAQAAVLPACGSFDAP